jgi:anti-sigma B factor antagonist
VEAEVFAMTNLQTVQPDKWCTDVTVREQWSGSVLVAYVSGAIDLMTAPTFSDGLRRALEQHPSALVVDLSDVDFLAAHGLTELLIADEEAGGTTIFSVVSSGWATNRPLEITHTDERLAVYPTLDNAIHPTAA